MMGSVGVAGVRGKEGAEDGLEAASMGRLDLIFH